MAADDSVFACVFYPNLSPIGEKQAPPSPIKMVIKIDRPEEVAKQTAGNDRICETKLTIE